MKPSPFWKKNHRPSTHSRSMNTPGAYSLPSKAPGSTQLILGKGEEETTVHRHGSGIVLEANAKMYTLEGQPLGRYHGILEPSPRLELRALLEPPKSAPVTAGKIGGLPSIPIFGRNQITFHFNEEDSITVVGQGSAQIARPQGNEAFLMVTVMNLVANGTGPYLRSQGVQAATGVAVLPNGSPLKPGSSLRFSTTFSLELTSSR